MTKLWTGRFSKETDHLLDVLNASLPFDQKMAKQDIQGSLAHVKMLKDQKIISSDDYDQIRQGLTSIQKDLDEGRQKKA